MDDNAYEFRGYGHRSIERFLEDCVAVQTGEVRPGDLKGLRATFEESRLSTAVIEAVNRSLERNGSWMETDLSPG